MSLSSLHAVELQLVMRCCDPQSLVQLARCSRTLLAAAMHPFPWQFLPLQPTCGGVDHVVAAPTPLDFLALMLTPAKLALNLRSPLLRQRQIDVEWRRATGGSDLAVQIECLARMPPLHGLSVVGDQRVWELPPFDDDALTQLCAALLLGGHARSLVRLHISPVDMCGAGFRPLRQLLSQCNQLDELHLQMYQPLGAQPSAVAPPLLHNDASSLLPDVPSFVCRLSRLTLHMHAPVPGWDQSPDASLLAALIDHPDSRLRSLHRSVRSAHFMDGAVVIALDRALQHCVMLERLSLSDLVLTQTHGPLLADALARLPALSDLSLSCVADLCGFMLGLPGRITDYRCLTTLKLSGGAWLLEDNSAAALAECVRRSGSLTALDLSDGSHTDAALTAVAAAVGQSVRMRSLRLGHLSEDAPDASDAGGLALASALRCRTLSELHLGPHALPRQYLHALSLELPHCSLTTLSVCVEYPSSEDELSLLTAIGSVLTLDSLTVCSRALGPPASSALADAIAQCRSLHTLDLSVAPFIDAGIALIMTALPFSSLSSLSINRDSANIYERDHQQADAVILAAVIGSPHLRRLRIGTFCRDASSDSLCRELLQERPDLDFVLVTQSTSTEQ